jgi:hypothetical protein
MILGGAGDVNQTNILVESLKENVRNKIYADRELRKHMRDRVLVPLHRDYNAELSQKVGLEKTQISFYPPSLIAAKLKAGSGLYRVELPHIYPIVEYEAVGSGFILAQFLFKSMNRWLKIIDEKWIDRQVSQSEKTCGYMINEIKESDLYTGGKTKVMSVTDDGVHELSDEDIYYQL